MDFEPIRRPEIWLQCTSGIFIVRTFMSKRVRRIRLRASVSTQLACTDARRSIARSVGLSAPS